MSTDQSRDGGRVSLKRSADEDTGNGISGNKTIPIESAKSVPPKRTKKKHTDPAILQFRSCVQQSCKKNDLMTAMTAYDQAIAANTKIEAQSFYSLLNLCDGLGDTRGLHIGTPQVDRQLEPANTGNVMALGSTPSKGKSTTCVSIDDVSRRQFAERVKTRMDSLRLPLTETAYTALVRLYCRMSDIQEAESTITHAETTQQCKVKLRLYSPLLCLYCDMGRRLDAVTVWCRLSTRGLTLTEFEYCALIHCCTKVGDASVLGRVMSDLAEDVLVPSHKTTKAIKAWFQSSHAIEKEIPLDGTSTKQMKSLLEKITVPYEQTLASSMEPVQCIDSKEWTISHSCSIDSTVGRLLTGCLRNEMLHAISLSTEAWSKMIQMNETIAVTGKLSPDDMTDYQGGGKGRKMAVDAEAIASRQAHWKAFHIYLELRSKEHPVNVVIDGANVGYFEKNFAGAPRHVDYEQIDWVVQHFIRQNKSVLLIMHSRHFARHFLPREAEKIVQRWDGNEKDGILFRTPPGMNDDWFWLHAALYFGPGTLLVTNDEMRDHHFQMVAPRSFLRWRDRHQIHFSFGNWEKNPGRLNNREVKLDYPVPYSRRMQRVSDGLVIPLPKQGDTNRFLDGSFDAEMEPVEETYMCIRPTSKN